VTARLQGIFRTQKLRVGWTFFPDRPGHFQLDNRADNRRLKSRIFIGKKREKSDHCKAQICSTVLPTASLILSAQSFASSTLLLFFFFGAFSKVFPIADWKSIDFLEGGQSHNFSIFPFWVRSSSKSPRLLFFLYVHLFLIRSNQLEDIFSYKYTFVCLFKGISNRKWAFSSVRRQLHNRPNRFFFPTFSPDSGSFSLSMRTMSSD
jgi:hypothetical protein